MMELVTKCFDMCHYCVITAKCVNNGCDIICSITVCFWFSLSHNIHFVNIVNIWILISTETMLFQTTNEDNFSCALTSVKIFLQRVKFGFIAFSALMLLVLRQKGHLVCKNWWLGAGVVICLGWGAVMAQLMPLPLTVSCFSKMRIAFSFLVPAYTSNPRQSPEGRKTCVWCVCVCLCVMFGFLQKRLDVAFTRTRANIQVIFNYNDELLRWLSILWTSWWFVKC